ncbi:MAG: phospholipase A, partial [Pararheinheimera sp.]|nr:phospholipase A [Rheinheimera sp.]
MNKGQQISKLTVMLLLSSASAAVSAQDVSVCQGTMDNKVRLACYDRIFGTTSTVLTETENTAQTAVEADVEVQPQAAAETAVVAEPVAVATVMQKYWELTPEEKRDRFVFRTYQPNFFLPAHITSNINKAPQSPTRGQAETSENYKQMESKIQVSLRAKLMTEFLLPGADLWFAFSQRS